MISDKIRKLAELKRHEVDVAGEKLLVREPNALEHIKFREIRKSDGEIASVTFLLKQCVINEDGTPALSDDDAAFLASGSARVGLLLLGGILSEVSVKNV